MNAAVDALSDNGKELTDNEDAAAGREQVVEADCERFAVANHGANFLVIDNNNDDENGDDNFIIVLDHDDNMNQNNDDDDIVVLDHIHHSSIFPAPDDKHEDIKIILEIIVID